MLALRDRVLYESGNTTSAVPREYSSATYHFSVCPIRVDHQLSGQEPFVSVLIIARRNLFESTLSRVLSSAAKEGSMTRCVFSPRIHGLCQLARYAN